MGGQSRSPRPLRPHRSRRPPHGRPAELRRVVRGTPPRTNQLCADGPLSPCGPQRQIRPLPGGPCGDPRDQSTALASGRLGRLPLCQLSYSRPSTDRPGECTADAGGPRREGQGAGPSGARLLSFRRLATPGATRSGRVRLRPRPGLAPCQSSTGDQSAASAELPEGRRTAGGLGVASGIISSGRRTGTDASPWQRFTFRPEPQGHGSLRPAAATERYDVRLRGRPDPCAAVPSRVAPTAPSRLPDDADRAAARRIAAG